MYLMLYQVALYQKQRWCFSIVVRNAYVRH
nr:MAG TPA: Putative ribose 5-phosphate isomerase [Caudoviricetes sp.]